MRSVTQSHYPSPHYQAHLTGPFGKTSVVSIQPHKKGYESSTGYEPANSWSSASFGGFQLCVLKHHYKNISMSASTLSDCFSVLQMYRS